MTGTDYINRGIGSLFYDASYLDDSEGLKPWKVFVEFRGNDLVKHDENNDVVGWTVRHNNEAVAK